MVFGAREVAIEEVTRSLPESQVCVNGCHVKYRVGQRSRIEVFVSG
jgi:hypothetical protein